MPTINIQADVSIDALVQAAEQLSETELRRFTSQILALNAKRAAPNVTQSEAELLVNITRRLPEETQLRYDDLIAKRDAETLSDTEHDELLRLTMQVEAFDVSRVEALTQLAECRGVPLSVLMHQLGIDSPAHE